MRAAHRVDKLERSRLFVTPRLMLQRYYAFLDGAALRLTGQRYVAIQNDSAALELVRNDFRENYVRGLSNLELQVLEQEMKRLLEAGRRGTARTTGHGGAEEKAAGPIRPAALEV